MDQATLNVLYALGTVVALVISIVAFLRAHPDATPAAVDTEAALRLQELQHNREFVARLEQAYQQQSVVFQGAFDTLTSLFKLIAPLTPIKTDDAVSGLLEDIQKPGDPIPHEPAPVG